MPERTTITVKVTPELKARYKRALSDRQNGSPNMSQDLTDHIERVVADGPQQPTREDGGFYPSDDRLREVYEACWSLSDEDLRLYERRHGSALAERVQVPKDTLPDALMPLRRKGYVAKGPMPVGLQGEAAARWRYYRVKPPCADPTEWVHREDRERDHGTADIPASEPSPEETLRKYERAGIEPPEELVAADGGDA